MGLMWFWDLAVVSYPKEYNKVSGSGCVPSLRWKSLGGGHVLFWLPLKELFAGTVIIEMH
jgi:hypothetical protein